MKWDPAVNHHHRWVDLAWVHLQVLQCPTECQVQWVAIHHHLVGGHHHRHKGATHHTECMDHIQEVRDIMVGARIRVRFVRIHLLGHSMDLLHLLMAFMVMDMVGQMRKDQILFLLLYLRRPMVVVEAAARRRLMRKQTRMAVITVVNSLR